MNNLIFTVQVTALVSDNTLDFDDRDVAGDYCFCLSQEAGSWTKAQQAKAVLDQFHDSIAIAVLDDFEIRVFNEQGEEVFEEDE